MAAEEATGIAISTALGVIRLKLRRDAAPETVEYISKCITAGLYDGRCFYRSDFALQCGLHGSAVENPFGDLSVNETKLHKRVSNTRGTAAVAHWDVPDCGNTEFFINMGDNPHLDDAYGGYCVFAEVDSADAASFAVVDKVAEQVKGGTKTVITKMELLA